MNRLNELSMNDTNGDNRNHFSFQSNPNSSLNYSSELDSDSNRRIDSHFMSPFIDSYPWSTQFWNRFSYSPPLESQLNDCFDPKENDWFPKNEINFYSTETNINSMAYEERNDLMLRQSPIGTQSLPQPFESNGQLVEDIYIQPRMRRRLPTLIECVFCKNNNEEPDVYKSHILKDPESRIVCPILRAYDCPICHNGGGDNAHTVRYCPLNRAGIHVKLANILLKSHNNADNHYCGLNYGKNYSKNEPKRNRRKNRSK
jgi:hypothetical protein